MDLGGGLPEGLILASDIGEGQDKIKLDEEGPYTKFFTMLTMPLHQEE